MGLIYLKSDSSTTYPVLNLIDFNLSGTVSIVLSAITYKKAGTYTIINWTRNITGYSSNLNISLAAGSVLTLSNVFIDTTNKKVTVTLV
jgi:hypothetical protein